MKKLLFFALLSLFGKEPSEKRIPYRPLTWADFRGLVPENEPTVAARTCTQIELQTVEQDGRFHFHAVAYFLADSSFVRVRDDKTLRHEQTHFTIACIEAAKCNRALAILQGGDSTMEKAASALYDHFFDQNSRRQDQFDLETNHSLNPAQEQIWETSISRELRTFDTPSTPIHGRNR